MITRLLKILLVFAIAVAGLCAALYALGFRLVLDGAGMPYVSRQKSADEQAAAIARHREAQREQAPLPPAAPSPPAPSPAIEGQPTRPAQPVGPVQPPNASAALQTSARGAYWTDFRGPRRDGHYREQPILTAWPASGLTPLWKQPVGGGYASFVIAHGRAFTIEQRAGEEVVSAYDVTSGRELWTSSSNALFREMMGGDGPRATPTWHDGVVYALGAMGELRALDDRTGRQHWRANILRDARASNLQWGMSAAPLVVGEHVVVLPGGSGGKSVLAYERRSGRIAWSSLDDRASYSSPMLVTIAGVEQVLAFTASRLAAISPANGELLWEFPWRTQYDVNASQPLVVGENRVFISTGYGTGAAMIEVSRDGQRFAVRELWRTNRMKNQFTSSVLHDGFIYGLDEAILACLDAATGELKWKGGRYGYGQVMLASGHLIVTTEGGDLALVRATPERHDEVVRFAAIDGKTWNHPAIADGVLLIRNITEMAAFDLRTKMRQ